jgi:ABC-2 type transport system permease protein
VSIRGLLTVAGVECSKLAGQLKVRILLAVCVIGPLAFAVAMRVQSSLPVDTLFGRAVKESGFAVSMVVLGFAALWAFPMMTSVVGGDLFSAEDRYGTWPTLLTRSRSRAEVFGGKVLTALGFSLLAMVMLAVSSVVAGLLVIGTGPLIDLTGVLLPPTRALARVTLAWASVLPPALGFTATRSSAAGIGLPVVAGLTMQLYAFVDGPEAIRRLLITYAFGAWHGLLSEPPYYRPLLYGMAVSAAYLVVGVAFAYRLLRQRDIGG